MKIALIQTNPQGNIEANISEVLQLINKAVESNAELVVLPEMFTYMGDEKGRLASAEKIDSGAFQKLQLAAKQHRVLIVGGSHSEQASSTTHVFNTCVVFDSQGKNLSTYRKIHLFNLRDADGKPLYCESDVFLAGSTKATWSFTYKNKIINCLSTICYDVRFPELFRCAKDEPSLDMIFVPAAFTHQTGKDHWEVLLRARAIENQCYVIACNQTGFFAEGTKRNFGHSMVVDPWGNVIVNAEDHVGVFYADVDFKKISEARGRLPALADRKIW